MNDDVIYCIIQMLDNRSCIQLFNTCKYINEYKKNGYLKLIVYDRYITNYNTFILNCSIHFKHIKSFVFKNIDNPFDWIPFDVPTIYLYNCIFSKTTTTLFKQIKTIYIINTNKIKITYSSLSMFPNIRNIYIYGNVKIPPTTCTINTIQSTTPYLLM